MTTVAQIRAEHEAAMASLTPTQRQAIDRETRAGQMAAFTLGTRTMRLEVLFDIEAQALNADRSKAPAG